MGGLLGGGGGGGGGGKGFVGPPLKLLGGALAPPLPTPMYRATTNPDGVLRFIKPW